MLLTRCFGAQAMTVGLLLFTSDMTARSFTAFGLAMLPYLGFNAWFLGGPGKGYLRVALAGRCWEYVFLAATLLIVKLIVVCIKFPSGVVTWSMT
ncbi:hypothetical protein B0O99DRAFT_737310 [Bisporella sp. PMI_857]|nr:hypothetical protein B0O99DRAFT_612312 [Bisporella sp. PMI_857]KAH8600539.1 hypothetical protein B0O99DRAFT_737310 [Bisporella sp. PMI_857]